MRVFGWLVCWMVFIAGSATADPLRIAMSEAATGETAPFLLALERLEDAGVTVEVTIMKTDGAVFEAVEAGTADLGVGTPFQHIESSGSEVRAVAQLSRLAFSLVVSAELNGPDAYNGMSVMLHAPGSGTEATSWAYERELGVQFGPPIYVGGSDNRAVALMGGAAQAAVIDFENRNLVLDIAGDRFVALQPLERPASDDVLYATEAVREARAREIAALKDQLKAVWSEMREDPTKTAASLGQETLGGRLSDREFNALPRLFSEAIASGAIPNPETPEIEIATADADVHSPGSSADKFWDLSFGGS